MQLLTYGRTLEATMQLLTYGRTLEATMQLLTYGRTLEATVQLLTYGRTLEATMQLLTYGRTLEATVQLLTYGRTLEATMQQFKIMDNTASVGENLSMQYFTMIAYLHKSEGSAEIVSIVVAMWLVQYTRHNMNSTTRGCHRIRRKQEHHFGTAPRANPPKCQMEAGAKTKKRCFSLLNWKCVVTSPIRWL